MNNIATDMALKLEAEGLGSMGLGTTGPGAGTGIFVGEEPPEPSESYTLYAYGGDVDDGLPTDQVLDRFRLQVRTRARTYKAAWDMAVAAERELNLLKNYSVADGTATVWYIVVHRLQPPTEGGRDEKRRFIFTQNYAGMRQRI